MLVLVQKLKDCLKQRMWLERELQKKSQSEPMPRCQERGVSAGHELQKQSQSLSVWCLEPERCVGLELQE